jgi:hypothetical protein
MAPFRDLSMEARPYGRIATGRPPRRRLWPYATAVFAATSIVVVTVYAVPLRSEQVTGIDWHTLISTASTQLLRGGAFMPSPAHCVGQTSYVCSDLRVAFNWSTSDGRAMSFGFQGQGEPYPVTIYSSTNQSWGGYSLVCGRQPRDCGEAFNILTNDTSGYAWNFDWEVFYNYSVPEPLL